MDIAVIVKEFAHWEAFIRDLRDLWVIERSRRTVVLGDIRYRMIDLEGSPDQWRGQRYDKIYIYNCVGPVDVMLSLRRPGNMEVVQIWN